MCIVHCATELSQKRITFPLTALQSKMKYANDSWSPGVMVQIEMRTWIKKKTVDGFHRFSIMFNICRVLSFSPDVIKKEYQ